MSDNDPRTVCELNGLAYNFKEKKGDLYMGPCSAADMDGCIGIFTEIDPEVTFIQTWRSYKDKKVEDTAYALINGTWLPRLPSLECQDFEFDLPPGY